MSITKKFSKVFDVMDPAHVLWLRELHLITLDEKSPEASMNNNPFGIKVSKTEVLEWINIMFALAMKYSMAVLEGKAWIPAIQPK